MILHTNVTVISMHNTESQVIFASIIYYLCYLASDITSCCTNI